MYFETIMLNAKYPKICAFKQTFNFLVIEIVQNISLAKQILHKSIKDDVHRTRKEGKDKKKETRTH